MKALELHQVSIVYADNREPNGVLEAARNISFSLNPGKIGCLLGPSGCGKTSVLRAIAGFVGLSQGEIRLNGEIVSGQGQWRAPEYRNIGVVFQDYALFPHLSVADNVAFGLTKGKRLGTKDRPTQVTEMLGLVGLKDLSERYPHELSGGQQQRVALARALAPKPGLVLLDEPFSNLDISLRERLAREVRDILRDAQTTAVLVTHDQQEAFAVADEVGVMFDGELAQWGDPYSLYHEPSSLQVARFVGEGALISGAQRGHHVQTPFGELALKACCCGDRDPQRDVRVLLRPDDVVHDDHAPMQARVVRKAFRGADFLYTLELPNGEQILSLVPSHHDHALNEAIGIRLEADHVVTFADTEPASPF
jgi:iron(III) transport system ATP-binding protein